MFHERHNIRSFLRDKRNVAAITVEVVKGSVPREAGAWMLVSADKIFRTIGGGNLEFIAVEKARHLLSGRRVEEELSIPLGPEIGQCCGGHVNLRVRRLSGDEKQDYVARVDQELDDLPSVFVFGAGHVGKCLIEAFSLLPVRAVLVDQRADELNVAPYGIDICLTALPEALVETAPSGSAFVILTHDHSLDFLIAKQALARKDARYVGMIGSKSKRAMFSRWLKDEIGTNSGCEPLICPIGNQACDDKRPEVIAGFVAAEVMAHLCEPKTQPLLKQKTARVWEES